MFGRFRSFREFRAFFANLWARAPRQIYTLTDADGNTLIDADGNTLESF